MGYSNSATSSSYPEFWQPRTHGFKAWSISPELCNNTAAPTAGTVTLVRVPIPESIQVSNVVLFGNSAGSLITNFYVGLYDSSRALLQGSADVKASLTSSTSTLALGATVNLTGGTDAYVMVALLCVGGTAPTLFRNGSGLNQDLASIGLAANAPRAATSNTGASALPATANAYTKTGAVYFVALS